MCHDFLDDVDPKQDLTVKYHAFIVSVSCSY